MPGDGRTAVERIAPHLNAEQRRTIAAAWRRSAEQFRLAARAYREAGDPPYADELEASAVDYDAAAEQLELTAP